MSGVRKELNDAREAAAAERMAWTLSGSRDSGGKRGVA